MRNVDKLVEAKILAAKKQEDDDVRNIYWKYVKRVHEGRWLPGKFHMYVCNEVQKFIETKSEEAYEILVIQSPPQHGKLLADITPVLTTNGWKTHGELHEGDYVYGRDGMPKRVLGEMNHDYADCEVLFSDGERIVAHDNHEWVVYDRHKKCERIVSTREMMDADYHERFYVDAHIHSSSHIKREVVFIKKVEPVPGKCICVEDGVYLCGKRLIPTHNSQMVTGTLPSWYLGKNPYHRVLEVSYNTDLAEIFGRDNRNKITTYGQELFGISLAKNPAAAAEFKLTNEVGGMISCGIMAGISGKSAELVIIDDPVRNRQDADSKTFRDRQYAEWQNSIKSRLQAKTKIIVIMTPWHEDDLAARIIATEKNVRVLRFPCECEDEDDLLGREIGDALCPEIGKDNKWLESFKAGYVTGDGMRAWNALYQCRPTGVEGNMILREDWRTIDTLPEIPYVCISVDATFNDKKGSDKVAIHLWGKSDNKYICLAIDKRRMDFPTTLKSVMNMRERCKDILGRYPEATYIEAKANGEAVISVLREKVDGIIPVTPTEGKEARVQSILPIHQAGQVYVWKECRGSADMIEECAAFPTGAHDDDVDAFSQALSKLRNITARTKHPTTPISDFFNIMNVEDESPLGGVATVEYMIGGY